MMTDSQKIIKNALPHDEQAQINWLQLYRSSRVGPATFVRLLREYGSCKQALDALPEIARAAGVKNYKPCSNETALGEWNLGKKMGFSPVFLGMPNYPPLLAHIPDAPPFLWVKGNIELAHKNCVAIIGARNASSLGQRTARAIAKDLGELGYIVVSGLARGIDTCAHQASINSGTIAVIAGGCDIAYPKENQKLHNQIATQGLCISEQPIGLHPQARHFPQRNRLIAGLALGVSVIEGAMRSGSLITAKNALDLGREVMAVPGHPMDARTTGCNMLIRDGSTLIRSAQDIDEVLKIHRITPQKTSPETSQATNTISYSIPDDNVSEHILKLLTVHDAPEDMILRDIDAPAAIVTRHLSTLEIQGKIERKSGGLLALCA